MTSQESKPSKKYAWNSGRPETEELALLLAAARMYYEHKNTQQEIADHLGVSRSTVSRLIDRASELGIVQISVRNPYSRASELRHSLIDQFGLADAVVTPTLLNDDRLIAQDLGKAAANYIVTNIAPGAIVGVGRGMSVFRTVSSLPQVRLSPTAVPLAGGMGQADVQYPVAENTRRFAEQLGGKCCYLYAPVVVKDESMRDAFLSEANSRQVVSLWDQLDWVVTGVGRVPPRDAHSTPQYTKALRSFIEETGVEPVADLFSWFVTKDGKIPLTVKAGNTISALPAQVSKAKVRLAVAGGISKVGSIAGVLRSGIITVLVTNETTAEAVVALE